MKKTKSVKTILGKTEGKIIMQCACHTCKGNKEVASFKHIWTA